MIHQRYLGPEYGAALVKIFYIVPAFVPAKGLALTGTPGRQAGTSACPPPGRGFKHRSENRPPRGSGCSFLCVIRTQASGKIIVIAIWRLFLRRALSHPCYPDKGFPRHQPGRRAGCGGTDGTDPACPRLFHHHIIQPVRNAVQCSFPGSNGSMHPPPCAGTVLDS